MGPEVAHREPLGRHLNAVEGLRGVAAYSVFVFHIFSANPFPAAGPRVSGPLALVGDLRTFLAEGVTLFFVLSGFLLFRPYAAALLGRGKHPRATLFLRNRVLRIVPAYWVALTLAMLVLGQAAPGAPATVPLYYLFLQDYLPSTVGTVVGPAWSLGVEALFYLFLPVLGAVLLARGGDLRSRERWLGLFLAVGWLVTLAGNLAFVHSGLHNATFYPFLLYVFAPGMALAWLHARWDGVAPAHLRRPLQVAGVGGLLLAVGSWHYAFRSPDTQVVVPAVVAIGLALAVLPLVLGAGGAVARFLSLRPIMLMGTISYSYYLWHQPVMLWAAERGLTSFAPDHFWINLAAFTVLVTAISALSYRLVERPFMRLRRTWAPSGPPA
ncbi:MAG: acyltransferase family protein [Candidatus Dormibacteria bacterium]